MIILILKCLHGLCKGHSNLVPEVLSRFARVSRLVKRTSICCTYFILLISTGVLSVTFMVRSDSTITVSQSSIYDARLVTSSLFNLAIIAKEYPTASLRIFSHIYPFPSGDEEVLIVTFFPRYRHLVGNTSPVFKPIFSKRNSNYLSFVLGPFSINLTYVRQ
jgi:hypothetical protein